MAASASEWNAKYRAQAEEPQAEPARFRSRLLPLLPLGPALDLACGTGRTVAAGPRHSRLPRWIPRLLRWGFSSGTHPTPIARSRASNARRSGEAAAWEFNSASRSRGTNLPAQAFSLVVCVNYLQRSLFSQIERTLVPGGVLLFETYTVAQLEFAGGPTKPKLSFGVGRVENRVSGAAQFVYRELRAGKGIASLIAKKPQ